MHYRHKQILESTTKRTTIGRVTSLHLFNVHEKLRLESFEGKDTNEHSPLMHPQKLETTESPMTPNRRSPFGNKSTSDDIKKLKFKLPVWYRGLCYVLLVAVAVASPSMLAIPYFIVMTCICIVGQSERFWQYARKWLFSVGTTYMLLHLLLICIFQVESIHNSANERALNVLGIGYFHVKLIPYADIKNTRLVPQLMQALFMFALCYLMNLRATFVHYRYVHLREKHVFSNMRPQYSSTTSSFFSPIHPKAHSESIVQSKDKKKKKKKKKMTMMMMKKKRKGRNTYTQMLESTDVDTPIRSLPQIQPQQLQQQQQQQLDVLELPSTSIQKTQDPGRGHDAHEDRDELLLLPTTPALSASRNRSCLSVPSFKNDLASSIAHQIQSEIQRSHNSAGPSAANASANAANEPHKAERSASPNDKYITRLLIGKRKDSGQPDASNIRDLIEYFVAKESKRRRRSSVGGTVPVAWERMNEWLKWKLFLNGPLICQISLLWICMAHKDATYVVILLWSFLSLFVPHDKTHSMYYRLALIIIIYSVLVSSLKFVFYIPQLITDHNHGLKDFGLYDFGDKCGAYLFFSCVPFLVLSAWTHSQHYQKFDEEVLMAIIAGRKIVDAQKVTQTCPLNWTRLRSHRGGNALHACVENGATELIPWIAPYVHCNARDMYGRLPLQQAIQIRNKYPTNVPFQKRYNDLIVELVRAGCRRTNYLSTWEKIHSFLALMWKCK
ncbi:hypothetical protein RFI_18886 [Reticulomyxa filosa]|uniref:Uncharacterized protein n=1 Tax=Reticulomyxa filosa TaxID=46433 RepID=X6MXQ9_RETFI|nr:hypothetical protein RFI_18886 [Reticulomyxa filosa]|eukprot:ETO18381.1 hypothetical protein RFI_18886 [Reticulomyxa filosa]